MDERIFVSREPFRLECGAVLPRIEVAYNTFGRLNSRRDNAIWVCHALTADSDVRHWWGEAMLAGRFLDPERHFIVCANMLGSPYGSTSAKSIDPTTGRCYGLEFPLVTVRDIVRSQMMLADALGLCSAKMIVGSSIGGFQAMEWLVMAPSFARSAVLISSAAKASAWLIAFNEAQRMALECDATFTEVEREESGACGLATARAIAMLSYRGGQAYNLTQSEPAERLEGFRAASYQRYQGRKLAARFDARCYHSLTRTVDTHDIGRQRGGVGAALRRIDVPVTCVAVSSDILFPVAEVETLARTIPHGSFHCIDSDFGHDGFLVENEKLNQIINTHLDSHE